jgi:hypothetical protein
MLKVLLAMGFLVMSLQAHKDMKVGRIYVNTQHNASIIFEYAFAVLPENEVLQEGAIDCLVSNLKRTGLFTDVKVELKQSQEAWTRDFQIIPTWTSLVETYTIDEIVFEKFKGIDEEKLRFILHQKGLSRGALLMRHPVSNIEAMVKESIQESIVEGKKRNNYFFEKYDSLSTRIYLIAPDKVRIVIIRGDNPLCNL